MQVSHLVWSRVQCSFFAPADTEGSPKESPVDAVPLRFLGPAERLAPAVEAVGILDEALTSAWGARLLRSPTADLIFDVG